MVIKYFHVLMIPFIAIQAIRFLGININEILKKDTISISQMQTVYSSLIKLKVKLLPTTHGIKVKGLFKSRYPKTVNVKKVGIYAHKIAVYGAANKVWIAPKSGIGIS